MDSDVVVVGAGPAGLATAACLRRRGLEPVIVDRNQAVGDSWRWRYDRLHLHTPRSQSHLPGYRIPRRMGRWVARDDVVAYLEQYAQHHALRPRLGVEVVGLDHEPDGPGPTGTWSVRTATGEMLTTRAVVIATGWNHTPILPDWPGRDGFTGELLHARDYRNGRPYVGRDVLVVGAGNTGAEIAADLAESGAGRVRLAVRSAPNVIPRQIGPIPTTLLGLPNDWLPPILVDPGVRALTDRVVGDVSKLGLPSADEGIIARHRRTNDVPLIDVGLLAQLEAGRVEVVGAVEAFHGERVELAGGDEIEPDVVIAATGYRPALERILEPLGVLDERGLPRTSRGGQDPDAPGLWFVGLTNPLKGLLFQINLDARAVARAVAAALTAPVGV